MQAPCTSCSSAVRRLAAPAASRLGLLARLAVIAALLVSYANVDAQGDDDRPIRVPTQAEIEAAIATQRGIVPDPTSVLPARVPNAVPDLAELARQYDAIRRGPSGAAERPDAPRQAAGLLVFVSLGMPRPALQRIVADAERVGAVLLLRGVRDGSLRKTAASIHELLGDRRVPWQIDPTLFAQFTVTTVPTMVLVDPARPVTVNCGQQACERPESSKVAGDVSIGHALRLIANEDRSFAALASRFVAKLEGSR